MKILTIVWLALAALMVVLNHAAHYLLGYSGSPAVLVFTNRFFGLMVEIALFLLFIFPALWSELTHKGRLWSYIGLLGFWPLVVLTFYLVQACAPKSGDLTVRGLRDRIMRNNGLDELRRFAKEVNDQNLLRDQDLVDAGDLSSLTRPQKDAFFNLGEKYPWMHWIDNGDRLRGPSLLNYGDDRTVDFEWGFENRGHWGCSISVDGAKNETIPFPHANILRASDDVYFYYRL